MRYTVHHPASGLPVLPLFAPPKWPAGYKPVGALDAPGLERVFRVTNDNPAWSARSTSVGDVVTDAAGRAYLCLSRGWAQIA